MVQNWVKYLPIVVSSLNSLENKSIGYLKPASISSNLDDPRIDAAKDEHGNVSKETSSHWEDWSKNQTQYEQSSKNELKVDSWVFPTLKKEPLLKGFDLQVSFLHLNGHLKLSLQCNLRWLKSSLVSP